MVDGTRGIALFLGAGNVRRGEGGGGGGGGQEGNLVRVQRCIFCDQVLLPYMQYVFTDSESHKIEPPVVEHAVTPSRKVPRPPLTPSISRKSTPRPMKCKPYWV